MEKFVFNGNELAGKILENLKARILQLDQKPRLAIVLDGPPSLSATARQASIKYVQIKQKKAEELGIKVQVFDKLAEINQDEFEGVMVQLPSGEDLSQIDPNKDVDGLNYGSSTPGGNDANTPEESMRTPRGSFVPATVKAVEKVLDQALLLTEADVDDNLKIAIIGAGGNVGKPLLERMQVYGMNVTGFDLEDPLNLKGFKVIISCTGKEGLIKKEMVDEGVIVIDVGYPKGDFEENVVEKAAFFTPVPGGVGPVTVASLLENLVNAGETK